MPLKSIDYDFLYEITSGITPLEGDCGLLCGSVCCRPDNQNSLGIYLFPGEECQFTGREKWLVWEYHNPADYSFPDNWKDPVSFLKCTAPCPRDKRPLACRFFPLAPHILANGKTLFLIHETIKLPYRCPLIFENITIIKSFTKTIAQAWQILLRDPRIHKLVVEDSREREKTLISIPPVLWSGSI